MDHNRNSNQDLSSDIKQVKKASKSVKRTGKSAVNSVGFIIKHWKAIILLTGIITAIGVVLLGITIFMTLFFSVDNVPNCADSDNTEINIVTSADKNKNAKSTYGYLRKELKATPQSAAGIMGVWDFESSFNPKIVNTGGSGATGLAQWMSGRLTGPNGLLEFAKKKGKSWKDLQTQLEFTKFEVDHGYSGVKHIFKETNVHKASYDWLMEYEGMSQNPEQWFLEKGPSGQPGRYPLADHWFAKFGSSDPVSSEVVGADDSTSGQTDGCDSDSVDTEDGEWLSPFHGTGTFADDQDYGPRQLNGHYQFHDGMDFGSVNWPYKAFYAVHSGTVMFAGDAGHPEWWGHAVIVVKTGKLEIIYQEFGSSTDNIEVKKGQKIKAGQRIGTRNTSHLHLGIAHRDWDKSPNWESNNNQWINPASKIPALSKWK